MRKQIDQIVKIKEYRETAAMNEMVRAEHHLHEMIELKKKREKERDDYQKWRVKKENKLYNNVLKKKVYVKDLEQMRQEIVDLRLKEGDYEKAVDDAIEKEDEAKRALETAKQDYRQAVINTKKMQEVATKVRKEEELEEMRYEESELEEQAAISVSIGPQEEWER